MSYESLWVFIGVAAIIGIVLRIRDASIARKKRKIINEQYAELKRKKKQGD